MKILHIISSGGMYGAEAVILNMSRTLNKGPHQSILGVFSNSSHPNLQLHESAVSHGIESHVIPCKGQLDLEVPRSLRKLIQLTRADIVHAHGYKADVYLHFASRNLSTPLISTCHTWYDNDLFVRLYGAIDRRVLRCFDGVVAVSEDVKQRLLRAGVLGQRVRLIRNGIDLRPFATERSLSERSPHSLTVGLVGRLSREKGVDLFLHTASRVLADFPDTNFIVAGDGPDRVALQALAQELHIQHRVTLLGRREDMPALYKSMDIMVSASRQEGLPIALLEGMASSLPLVATSVGEVPTVVHHGSTGTLVPPENIDALASGILTLIRGPLRRSQYGDSARQLIADQFSADHMTAEYVNLYEQTLARGHQRAHDSVPRQSRVGRHL